MNYINDTSPDEPTRFVCDALLQHVNNDEDPAGKNQGLSLLYFQPPPMPRMVAAKE